MAAVAVPIATWVASTVAPAVATVFSAAGASFTAAFSAANFAYAATYAVSELALYVGMQYAIDAVTRPNIKPAGSELQLNIDPAYPREMIIGQRAVGGSMIARYSRDVNNYFAHLVIQIADHPCVELSKIHDGGRLVQDAPLVHGVRTEIEAYSNSGGPRLWMTFHDGRPGQTADADLVTKSATDPEVISGAIEGWTSDHRGAGCAYVHIEMRWDPDILTSIPQFTFLMKGARLYDRRKDTTAGGSGAHRLDDPSTWEYSTNAMVALDHYLLGYRVEDDPRAFGIGLSTVEVPYDQFAAAADLCDEDVETGTGVTIEMIKRYAANAVITTADYFEEVIEAFQVQMAARVVDLGGRIGILGAEERAITVSLTEDDLISGEPLQFSDKLAFADLIGSVTGTFSDPANNYQPTPFTPLYTQYQALPDGGEAQAVTLSLPYEVHPRRADRLVSAYAARETLQPRLAAVFTPKAWTLEAGDWFEFTSPRLQVTAAKFEVIDIVKNDDFTVIITARAIDPDFLAFDNDNDPDLSVPAAIAPLNLFLDEPEFDVEVTTLEAGGVIEPALEVTLTSDETVAREIVYEYAVWDAGAAPGDEIVGPTLVDSAHVSQIVTKIRKGILPDSVYAVRAKAKAGLRESPWTDWSAPITTGATYAVGSASSVPWSGVTGSGKPSDNADVTSANTAAAITGQGALATLGQVNLGVAGKVYRDDGTTRLTDSVAVTSLGTASAIASQGAFATLNTVNSSSLMGAGVVVYTALASTAVRLGTNITRSDGTTSLTDSLAVTSLGTAAAIAGQGWGATAAQSAIDNNLVPIAGFNKNLTFQAWASTLPDNYTINGTIATIAKNTTNVTYGAHCLDMTVGAIAGYLGASTTAELRLPPINTQYVTIEWEVELVSGTFNRAGIEHVLLRPNAANANTFAVSFETEHGASPTAGLYKGAKTVAFTASGTPTGDPVGSVLRLCMNRTTLTGGAVSAKQIRWSRVVARPATQQEIAASLGLQTTGKLSSVAGIFGDDLKESAGVVATAANFKTSLGTAAAISGQGSFATLSSAAYGSSLLTGFGTVAPLSQLYFGDGFVKETSGGTTASLANFKTSLGVASSITGQGSLALLSQVNLGVSGSVYRDDGSTRLTDSLAVTSLGTASAIASQGALATASLVALGASGRVYRDDGVTRLTDSLAVTSLGTASAISGQGNFATGNMYYQSSAPSSPNNGDFWGDTTANKLKYRSAGAWQIIADIGAGGFTATMSGTASNFRSGAGSVTTPTVTAVPANGSGSYTYQWRYVSGDATLSANSSGASTQSWTGSVTVGQTKTAIWEVVVTDTSNGATATARCTVTIYETP